MYYRRFNHQASEKHITSPGSDGSMEPIGRSKSEGDGTGRDGTRVVQRYNTAMVKRIWYIYICNIYIYVYIYMYVYVYIYIVVLCIFPIDWCIHGIGKPNNVVIRTGNTIGLPTNAWVLFIHCIFQCGKHTNKQSPQKTNHYKYL